MEVDHQLHGQWGRSHNSEKELEKVSGKADLAFCQYTKENEIKRRKRKSYTFFLSWSSEQWPGSAELQDGLVCSCTVGGASAEGKDSISSRANYPCSLFSTSSSDQISSGQSLGQVSDRHTHIDP